MASQLLAIKLSLGRKLLLIVIGAVVVAGTPMFGLLNAPRVRAQSPALDWQTAARGKLEFDVASVKHNNTFGPSSLNVPLGPGDVYTPTGGLFSGISVPLISYIYFAYNLTGSQLQLLLAELPKWVIADRFDVQARKDGNPTKDQMRLMMQSLLADRFKLVIHYETRQLPVFAAVPLNLGKTGPQLRPHPEGSPCSSAPPPASVPGPVPPPSSTGGGFPTVCGGIIGMDPSAPGLLRIGARNVPIGMIVATLAQLGSMDRPLVDQTGLSRTFDFTFEWTTQHHIDSNEGSQTDESGTTFLQALKEQLGLKLVPQTGPVDFLVIDHIEEPSEN